MTCYHREERLLPVGAEVAVAGGGGFDPGGGSFDRGEDATREHLVFVSRGVPLMQNIEFRFGPRLFFGPGRIPTVSHTRHIPAFFSFFLIKNLGILGDTRIPPYPDNRSEITALSMLCSPI